MNQQSTTSISHPILIVNADDFGYCEGVNAGIIQAHEQGIVTSTSLMVRGNAAGEATRYARQTSTLSVGLHVDLGEWSFQAGQWVSRYEVVPMNDPQRVCDEIQRQLIEFRSRVGREPTHLDSHQHVHRDGPARQVLGEIAAQLRIPLRHFHPGIRYCGDFYAQPYPGQRSAAAVSAQSLTNLIAQQVSGIVELACHPGLGGAIAGDYSLERNWELESLCDQGVRQAVVDRQILLCSFSSRAVRERLYGIEN